MVYGLILGYRSYCDRGLFTENVLYSAQTSVFVIIQNENRDGRKLCTANFTNGIVPGYIWQRALTAPDPFC